MDSDKPLSAKLRQLLILPAYSCVLQHRTIPCSSLSISDTFVWFASALQPQYVSVTACLCAHLQALVSWPEGLHALVLVLQGSALTAELTGQVL
jgi:hypothetical protein